MDELVTLLEQFRFRTNRIRGLPMPPNDDIGVSICVADTGEAKIVVELKGTPLALSGEERIQQIVSGDAPTHATAYFHYFYEAVEFLRQERAANWILSDEEHQV